jgi:hypothetical protein
MSSEQIDAQMQANRLSRLSKKTEQPRYCGGKTSPGSRQTAYMSQGPVTLEEARQQQKTAALRSKGSDS